MYSWLSTAKKLSIDCLGAEGKKRGCTETYSCTEKTQWHLENLCGWRRVNFGWVLTHPKLTRNDSRLSFSSSVVSFFVCSLCSPPAVDAYIYIWYRVHLQASACLHPCTDPLHIRCTRLNCVCIYGLALHYGELTD